MRSGRKKRWKSTSQEDNKQQEQNADEDIFTLPPEDDASHPLRPRVIAAIARLMKALNISEPDYICEPQQGTLSLKERMVFRERETRDRALVAVSSTLRITRTEYIETEDKTTKKISPFRHGFVMVADCPPEGRTRQVAYRTMIKALDAARNTHLCNSIKPQ